MPGNSPVHVSGGGDGPPIWEITSDRAGKVTHAGVNPIPMRVTQADPVQIGGYSTIGDGTKAVTTAGTAVQLSATSTPIKMVIIQALQSNGGRIAVGGSTVDESSDRGIILQGGDKIELSISNLNKVYLDSSVSGESVSYVYFS